MSHLGDNHLLCVAGEHCRGKLDAKEKAAFSFKYLLVYSFRVGSIKDALYPSGRPASFSCSLQILDEKCVEFSSELNGTILRFLSGYHADTPITIKAEPSIWPTAAFINIHEHPL